MPTAKPAAKAAEPEARLKTLDEAAAALETKPQSALAYLDRLVAQEPENERALALRMVALYDLRQYAACAKAMGEARTAGHPLLALAGKYPRFRKLLDQEKADPRLPRRQGPGQRKE